MVTSGDQVGYVVAIIDEAALAPERYDAHHTLHSALLSGVSAETPISEIPDVPIRAALWAFNYQVRVKEENGRQKVVVEPRFRGPSGETDPPEIADLSDEIIDAWHIIASQVRSPWGRARLHHLLFERRFGQQPHRHALIATENYLAAAKKWRIGLDSAQYLKIALRIARAVSATNLVDEVVSELLDEARQELTGDEFRPGVFFRLVKPILTERHPPASIDGLLESAFSRYADPFNQDEISRLQIGRARDATSKGELWERLVQLWIRTADSSDGILRAMHLKKALECAEESQNRDLVEFASVKLQELSKQDLGLTAYTASTAIDEAQIEQMLEPIKTAGDWQQALRLFCYAYGPSTGNLQLNEAGVAEHARQFPFQSLVSYELVGGDGLPRYHPQSDEDRHAMALARQESGNLQGLAPLLAMALSRIAQIHGIPTEEALTAFFRQSPFMNEPLARAIARAFIRYWMGDVEASAFTVVPRIEALVRNLVVATNGGVYRLQRDQKPGQYPGLGYLLEILEERGIDESWYRCVLTVCANPAGGWNMRNEMAHGFVDGMTATHAAVVLQIAIFLWSLRPSAGDGPSETDSAD